MSVYLVSALWPFDAFAGRAVDNPEEFCVDSDDSMNENLAGISIFRRSLSGRSDYRFDECIARGSRVREYYCDDNGRIRRTTVACEAGCEEKTTSASAFGLTLSNIKAGKCIGAQASCEDSDSESDNPAYDTGTATNELGEKKRDSCDGNNLTEYSCEDDKIVISTVECSYKCAGGKCIEAPSTCEDSDAGNKAESGGVVKSVLIETGNTTYKSDSCANNRVREYYCDGIKVKTSVVKCEGLCKKQSVNAFEQTFNNVAFCEPQPTSCSDSDLGKDAATAGTVTTVDVSGKENLYEDKCRGRNVLEYSCSGNSVASEEIECADVCVDGACVSRGDLCTDTDSGKNAGVKGTTSNDFGSFTDFCSNEKRLVEGYCKEGDSAAVSSKTNPLINLKTYICGGGCSGGVCLEPVEDTGEPA